MSKLPTNEFLAKRLGLIQGNPFSEKQAEGEDQLPKYFVDLPAFYEILDTYSGKPKSSILSANRGCGKSANRRNVERWLKQGPKQEYTTRWPWELPVLVVPYTDFSRLKMRVNGDFSKCTPEDHVDSILWNCISSLLEFMEKNWAKKKTEEIPKWIISQLGYFLVNYTKKWAYLKNSQSEYHQEPLLSNQTFDSFLSYACVLAKNANVIASGGETSLLQSFIDVSFAFGIKNIVVLVDGVDELDLTADNPEMGAMLIQPLIAELPLIQLTGLYFKFFLPSEVVTELKKMPKVRLKERIELVEINWDENTIQVLLSERLKAFSNGKLEDLGQIAAPDIKDIGQILAIRASNNPRNLLRLCEWLIIYLEQNIRKKQIRDRSQRPRITKLILDEAIKSYEEDINQANAYSTVKEKTSINKSLLFSFNGWEITSEFEVFFSGMLISSDNLDNTEYEILSYLIRNAGRLVERNEIKDAIWGGGVGVSDSALTQPIYRLRKKIGSQRIKTVRKKGLIFFAD